MTEQQQGEHLYKNADWLQQRYQDEGLSMEQIAELAECCTVTILNWMRQYDIPRRSPAKILKARWGQGDFDDQRSQLCQDADWLQQKYYTEKLPLSSIAKLAECSVQTVLNWMQRHNIPRRSPSDARKAAWKRGDYGSEDWKRRHSRGVKAGYDLSTPEGQEHRRKKSIAQKAAWERGVYDGVFQSPTSIEIAISEALNALGIEHVTQYRPDGYSRVYDELVLPNVLIEIHGDYWHSRPREQKRDAEKAAWAQEHDYHLVVL